MSNGRRPGRANSYRSGYLTSIAWNRRRDEWLELEVKLRGVLRCAVCQEQLVRGRLELHHLDYRGVQRIGGRWVADEHHDDLVAMGPDCHEALHKLLDSDRILRWHRSRRAATTLAIAALQRRLSALKTKDVDLAER